MSSIKKIVVKIYEDGSLLYHVAVLPVDDFVMHSARDTTSGLLKNILVNKDKIKRVVSKLFHSSSKNTQYMREMYNSSIVIEVIKEFEGA